MSEPRTEAGRKLAAAIKSNVLALWAFDEEGQALIDEAVAIVEAEATAAAEQRLRSALEVVLNHLNRAAQDVHYDEGHQPTGWQGCSTERCREVRDDMAHARALLDSGAPPPASPRQGEPVEGLDAAWREAEAAFPALGGWRMDAVVSHRKGDWKASAVPTPQSRRTANGSTWLGVTGTGPSPVEALRALAVALSEPAEAEQKETS